MPFVYVLHCHRGKEHGEHYVGAARDLRTRLARHANGFGSSWTRQWIAERTDFELATAWHVNSHAAAFEIERRIKAEKNGPRFCPICAARGDGDAKRIPFANAIAEEMPPQWIAHMNLALCVTTDQRLRFREAGTDDVDTCEQLRKPDKDALGFFGGALKTGITYHNVIIAEDTVAEQIVGYCLKGPAPHARGNVTKIWQIVVAEDYRRGRIATHMVELIRGLHPQDCVTCEVRSDLVGPLAFWAACGFEEQRRITHKTSGSELVCFQRQPIMAKVKS